MMPRPTTATPPTGSTCATPAGVPTRTRCCANCARATAWRATCSASGSSAVTPTSTPACAAQSSAASRGARRCTGSCARSSPIRRFADSPMEAMVEQWMLFNDPPKHTRLRRLANHAFRPPVIDARGQPKGLWSGHSGRQARRHSRRTRSMGCERRFASLGCGCSATTMFLSIAPVRVRPRSPGSDLSICRRQPFSKWTGHSTGNSPPTPMGRGPAHDDRISML